ncbi:MAG TPA: DUF4870 domain-containing protein [Pirellulales bacterium]|nr:DUF4870 domain-containing protein [Pirellulales bacterium]
MDQNLEPQGSPVEKTVTGNTMTEKDARLWGVLCHLTALSWLFTGVGGLVGPLVCWLLKKNDHPFVDENGKESLNFQISMHLYTLIASISLFCLIGFVLVPALLVANVVLVIIASVKAGKGEEYRYPLTIRLIS